ncbi:hypothetical protein LCGC14_2246940, partial [marine sediment metagenome]
MSLEIENENDEIRKAERRLKRLHSTYTDLIDKLSYFRAELKSRERLNHRKECL